MDADFEASPCAELRGADDPDHRGAVRVRRLFGGGSADRLRKSRPSRYCGRGGHAGFCRIFSYELHTEFGWQATAYPRYYLPLAAIVPLAGLSLLGAIKPPSARAILLVFLIAGPLLFRILGAPFG